MLYPIWLPALFGLEIVPDDVMFATSLAGNADE
jgi:hypothetical protein